jgi:hypothetical protein
MDGSVSAVRQSSHPFNKIPACWPVSPLLPEDLADGWSAWRPESASDLSSHSMPLLFRWPSHLLQILKIDYHIQIKSQVFITISCNSMSSSIMRLLSVETASVSRFVLRTILL